MSETNKKFNEQSTAGEGEREVFPYIIVARDKTGNRDISVFNLTVKTPGHNSQTLIKDLSMIIPHGEKVILTGASGSGKTTVAKALLNQWDYGTGVVFMPDGTRIMAQSQQAYFPNTNMRGLMNMTPEGKEKFTDRQLREALQKVGHDNLVQHIPGQQQEILMDDLLAMLKEKLVESAFENPAADVKKLLTDAIPALVQQQFNVVQYTPQEQRDYFRARLAELIKGRFDKPLSEKDIADIADTVVDTLDIEVAKPLLNQLTEALPDTAQRIGNRLLAMTPAKANYFVWIMEKMMAGKIAEYMANEDTDDQHREIRLNSVQADFVTREVAKKLRREMDKYNKKGFLSQTFNAVTWPLSLGKLYLEASEVAGRLKERLTFFMDRQIVTGESLTLSGGEKQKLMIAMVLLHQPDILILDEITAALDRPTGERLYSQMLEQIPKGTTVISIAHNEHIMKYHTLHAHLNNKTITLTPIKPEASAAAPSPSPDKPKP